MSKIHATTIFAIHHKGKCAIAGDGQVTLGNAIVMKNKAKKIRRLFDNKVVAGFAGSVADAFTLFEMFEVKLNEYNGSLKRAAVELAKQWRGDKILHKLEAMLIIADKNDLLLISGTGEVIEPDDGILAIGSGGNYALSAGRALKRYSGDTLSAADIAKAALIIASEICVYTNMEIVIEELG